MILQHEWGMIQDKDELVEFSTDKLGLDRLIIQYKIDDLWVAVQDDEIDYWKNQVVDVESEVSELKGEISELEAEVSNLEDKIEVLEEDNN